MMRTSMSGITFGVRVGFVLFFAAILAVTTAVAEQTADLPRELREILPGDTAALVTISSTRDLAEQMGYMQDLWDDPDHGEPLEDLLDMIGAELPGFATFADLDRPLAMAVTIPPMMAGEGPFVTFLVPVKELPPEPDIYEENGEFLSYHVGDGYVAYSQDPGYIPASGEIKIASRMSDTVVAASMDLETVFAVVGPMADMMLGMAAMAPAVPDSNGNLDPDQPSTEELLALTEMSKIIMDALLRFDLGLEIADGDLSFDIAVDVRPGCPLEAGPQPSMERARELSSHLPDHAAAVEVTALDQSAQLAVFEDYYRASLQRQIDALPADEAELLQRWGEWYFDAFDLFSQPAAGSLSLNETGIGAAMALECSDAGRCLEVLGGIIDELGSVLDDFQIQRQPQTTVAGIDVSHWTIDLPDEISIPTPDGGTIDSPLPADDMAFLLDLLVPEIRMGAKDGVLLFCASKDEGDLAEMIDSVAGGDREPHPLVTTLGSEGGPHCRQVFVGDLTPVSAWVSEMSEAWGEGPDDIPELSNLTFSAYSTLEGTHSSALMKVPLQGIGEIIELLEELDEYSDEDDLDEDDEDEEDEDEEDDD